MNDSSRVLAAPTAPAASGWASFWNRGGWWKAVVFAAGYLGLYTGVSLLVGRLWGSSINTGDLFGDPLSVFVGVALPVIVGAVILFAFAASVGWLPRPLFARQPIRGSWWMWLAPILVGLVILLRVLGIDWASYSVGVIAVTFLAGAFVGVSEELLTRGIAVTLLRRHGYNEWVVAVLSSLLFALLHLSNFIGGQSPVVVFSTVGFAFGFGMMMYLTLRATGSLIWPIILHALTDPTTFLATGGIDVPGTNTSPFLAIAGLSTIVFLLFALIALIFIRGNTHGRAAADEAATTPMDAPTRVA